MSAASSVATPAPSTTSVLTLTALGVVFGDIGTSPLYAFKEAFNPEHGIPLTEQNVLAVLSLIFWCVTLTVTVKYVGIVLRFDNAGEGGILALQALAVRATRSNPRLTSAVAMIAIFGASLFYGDAMITPAISVLSAVEGLSIATPAFEHAIVPVTIGILVGLFWIQRHGTGTVGRYFGRVTLLWFAVIGLLGAFAIVRNPGVLRALDPRYALEFAVHFPLLTFTALGAVFLAITGAEALYADMGHFGAKPVRLAWFFIAFPCLMANYFGQGALVLRDPESIKNPFYLLASGDWLLPLVFLATAATVIASQATISGAFSMTQQASRLGYLPRIPTRHTSATARGQIYIPQVNWLMLSLVVLLVLGFQNSAAMASAYGVAVSGTMLLTTALVMIVVWQVSSRRWFTVLLLGAIGCAEVLFFLANATKIFEGGWFPLLCGLLVFTVLTTWKRAETLISARESARQIAMDQVLQMMGSEIPRVPGTAIYLSPRFGWIPTAFLHNLKHYKVLHDRVIFLTVVDEGVPRIPDRERTIVRVIDIGHVYQVALHYGFMEAPDIPRGLDLLRNHGLKFSTDETTFFLSKTTLTRAQQHGWFTWRRDLFRWLQRNSPATAEYFNLHPERVIELGTRMSI